MGEKQRYIINEQIDNLIEQNVRCDVGGLLSPNKWGKMLIDQGVPKER